MKKKGSKNKYEIMANKAWLFSKELMEFAFNEVKYSEVIIDDEDDDFSIKTRITSSNSVNRIRILVEYLPEDNVYDVEITDMLEHQHFNFMISTYPASEIESIIPLNIRKALRGRFIKRRPDIN